jgi:hypothetical protein
LNMINDLPFWSIVRRFTSRLTATFKKSWMDIRKMS